MGSRERRNREKEELRERILETARDLFATNGFEATTMRMIADQIEYSATAIYSYFEDKEALLRELCERDFSTLGQSMGRALEITNPVERLEQIGELFVDFAMTHPNHYRFMFMSRPAARDGDRQGVGAQQAVYAFLRRAVEEVISSGAVRPEFRDPDLLTQVVWGSMHGIVALHLSIGHVKWIRWRPLKELSSIMRLALAEGVADMSAPPRREPPAAAARKPAGPNKRLART
jgi:AcrR family transcriptional regulator